MESEPFRIIEASTPAMCEAVYRLRYDVFYREEGDARYADHETATWRDRDDGPPSRLVAAFDDQDRAIGSIRLMRWQDKDFIAKETYRIGELAILFGTDISDLESRLCRADRGVVAAAWRGTSLIADLENFCSEMAIAMGCNLLVGVIKPENMRSRKAFTKLGWQETSLVASYGGVAAMIVYKDLCPPC